MYRSAAFFALKPGLSDDTRAARIPLPVFGVTVVPLVAAYDGFFGPGTGSFFMMGFVLLVGYGVLKATAHTKMLNFASNLGALLVFVGSAGRLASASLKRNTTTSSTPQRASSRSLSRKVAMRVGARLIKPLLVFVSTAMALRLLWQALG